MLPAGPASVPTPLTLCLFGAFALTRHHTPLPRTRSRKEQWLLALLAIRQGQALDRDWLAGVFWPDAREADALANLRRSLNDLRRVLGSDACRLKAPTSRTICLDLAGMAVDVMEFDTTIRSGESASLERAIALYRGPLLEGCAEEWSVTERREREELCIGALEQLAGQALERGEHSEAARLLHRAAAMDPLRESIHCALMETLAGSGDFAALDRHYVTLRLALHREVNAEPAAETTALYRCLRALARAAPPSVPPTHATPLRRLPCPLTRLIGRQDEIEAVAAVLTRERLVTLTGSGGVGKTRLAIAVAERVAESYADGVWFVDLASLSDPGLLALTVAAALGVREEPGRTPTQTLAGHLGSRTLLLLLDNCEHLLQSSRCLAEALLQSCAHLHVLATSREPLHIAGEQAYRVPSLAVPDMARIPPMEDLHRYGAVQLFAERARAAHAAFTITHASAQAVVQVCARLEGIPLALELAAARVRALPVTEINARLGTCFRLLTGGKGTTMPRQQTLRALIDWSYNLLNDQEKALLCRLSVFAGGWTLTAAEKVCGAAGIEDWQTVDVLTALVDKSLVVYEEAPAGWRYRLLETVRQYGRDRLAESEVDDACRRRHRDYFLAFAEDAKDKLRGPEQGLWLDTLETEHDNLRQALTYSLEGTAGGTEGLRLGAALGQFWQMRGHVSEGRERLSALLLHSEALEHTKPRADALHGAAALSWVQGDYSAANSLNEESLVIRRESGDKHGIAISVLNLGNVALYQGDYAAARSLYEESLAIKRDLGDRQGMAYCLNNLGSIAKIQGDYAAARSLHGESLAIRREIGDRYGIASSLNNLGSVAYNLGDKASARSLHQESLELMRELGDLQSIAHALNNVGIVARDQGDSASARSALEESLAIRRKLGDRKGIAQALNNLALIACCERNYRSARAQVEDSLSISRELGDRQGITECLESLAGLNAGDKQPERAAQLWGAAERLREEMSSPLPPNERDQSGREVAATRQAMGEEAFAAAWAEGRAMTMEQALQYALQAGRCGLLPRGQRIGGDVVT